MPTSSFAGRAFMPDMASLSLSIIALYLFARWLERAPAATLFVAMSLATSLAILVKPPAVLISVPLLAMGLFVMIAGAGNHRHDWYQLPFVPGAAALGGRARRCVVHLRHAAL